MSENHDLPATRESVLFDVEMALWKAEKLWPKGVRAGRHDRFRPTAMAVVDHLCLCGISFWRKPPLEGHKTPDPDEEARVLRHGGRPDGNRVAAAKEDPLR